MIELIMAIATSSLLAAALVGALADTERLSVSGQNQIVAAAIAQEQIDNVRNTLYGNLAPLATSSSGTGYTLLVNKTNAGQTGPANINPRPLLMDLTNLDWRTPAERTMGVTLDKAVAANEFQGTVTEIISTVPAFPNTVMVTITVSWQEGPAAKSYSISTLVAQQGIHIY